MHSAKKVVTVVTLVKIIGVGWVGCACTLASHIVQHRSSGLREDQKNETLTLRVSLGALRNRDESTKII